LIHWGTDALDLAGAMLAKLCDNRLYVLDRGGSVAVFA
jgi:hypothetical protein